MSSPTAAATRPKYYVAKTLIGSDPDYLPLLHNIPMMARMGDAAGAEVEAFFIMDAESIALTRKTPHHSGKESYFDFIRRSGCQIITIQELIDAAAPGEKAKELARALYTALQELSKFSLARGLVQRQTLEFLPVVTQADFAKSLFVHGFNHQHPSSVNICMDLDLIQNKPGSLPANPADFLRDSKGVGFGITVFYAEAVHLPPDLQKRLDEGSPTLKRLWRSYEQRIESGKTHGAFVGPRLVDKILEKEPGAQSPEYLAARSKNLPLESSLREALIYLTNMMELLQLEVKRIGETSEKPDEIAHRIQLDLLKKRKNFVDGFVYYFFTNWQRNVEVATAKKIIDPSTLGISGRCDIEKWKDAGREEGVIATGAATDLPHVIFSPNIPTEKELLDPWRNPFEQICAFAEKIERNGVGAGSGFSRPEMILGLDEATFEKLETRSPSTAATPEKPKTSILKSIATIAAIPLNIVGSGLASCCRRRKTTEFKPLVPSKQKTKSE